MFISQKLLVFMDFHVAILIESAADSIAQRNLSFKHISEKLLVQELFFLFY